ncbi:MAG TPA: BtpA/SgcQ family protein, partial [Armatimonadetes bacterium]|nr:BtpA/SgcQ family protein [Armatimonadota bacterium]
MEEVLRRAVLDARAYEEAGFSAVIVENFGDAPFLSGRVGPETVAAMAVAVKEVVDAVSIPVGVNVLRNDLISAISVAHASGGKFVRTNLLLGVAVAPEGLLVGEAGEALRLRRALGADIRILADVSVKHAKGLWARSVEEEVEELIERGLADALVVTGERTGRPPSVEELRKVREAAKGRVPVFLGSGLSTENASMLLPHVEGAIVGTSVKRGGRTEEPVDPERARELAEVARSVWASSP